MSTPENNLVEQFAEYICAAHERTYGEAITPSDIWADITLMIPGNRVYYQTFDLDAEGYKLPAPDGRSLLKTKRMVSL